MLAFFYLPIIVNSQEKILITENKQCLADLPGLNKQWMRNSPIHAKKATQFFNFLVIDKFSLHTNLSILHKQSLGVICRQELKLDQLTPLRLGLRLGSLAYVNWLEGKPHAALFP